MKRIVGTLVAGSLLIAGVALAAGPESIVLYRQTEMMAIGKHYKAANLIAKGEVDRPGDMVKHATALHDMSTDLCALFPAGSGPDKVKTEAKAEVWTMAPEFQKQCDAFTAETQKLVDAAKTNDKAQFATQLGKVGDTCGSCHDGFRIED